LGKPYGIKPRCYWEHLGEHIWELDGNKRNFMKSFWEHDGNTLGTSGKKQKIRVLKKTRVKVSKFRIKEVV